MIVYKPGVKLFGAREELSMALPTVSLLPFVYSSADTQRAKTNKASPRRRIMGIEDLQRLFFEALFRLFGRNGM